MNGDRPGAAVPGPEAALAALAVPHVRLRLYVAGSSRRSERAVRNVQRLCAQYLAGRYDLEVIDVYRSPVMARDGEIVAVPTLVRELPAPLRRLVGDLSDEGQVLKALDIHVSEATAHPSHSRGEA